MGYRSQVVLAIAPEAAHAFMALQAKHPEVMALCNDADEFMSGYETEGDYFMHWSDIKWYEDYPEIDSLMRFITAVTSDEDLDDYGESERPQNLEGGDIPWDFFIRFIRLGESHEDIEDLGGGFDDICISRSISFQLY